MRTLILGFDAFDPGVFERLSAQGRLPNLTRYAETKRYARFTVTNPAQSEVSWTSIMTGLDPGGHGIFDFVHRDPSSYALSVSLLPTKAGMFGLEFTRPFVGTSLFDYATQQGFPATSLWWPATFPARPESPVCTLPGLGTPDIHGRLGVGTLFSTGTGPAPRVRKTSHQTLTPSGKGRYSAQLKGPARQSRGGISEATVDLLLELVDSDSARLQVGRYWQKLIIGQWSPIFELTFKFGLFASITVLARAILTQVQPDVQLYFLPLQLHPLRSPWRYGTPQSYVKQVWKQCGPFLTLGWPQDTTGLEDGCISDEHFLQLCNSIFHTREHILMYTLQHFKEGVLAAVFDTLDRVQHMFWRDRPDIVEHWYEKLDGLVGRVEQQLAKRGLDSPQLIIVSDHGFTDFKYKVHLNRWLNEHGYLCTLTPAHGKDNNATRNSIQNVSWAESKAYAIGLNSLYLNLENREGHGCIQPDQAAPVTERLCHELEQWLGPDGGRVVQSVWRRDEIFHGPYSVYGPDLIIGYAPGYRGSAETGLGQWASEAIVSNSDHWGADHCVAAQAVPGVLFASKDLANYPHPSYRDIPPLAVGASLEPSDSGVAPPPLSSGHEDRDLVAERLKSLGYL